MHIHDSRDLTLIQQTRPTFIVDWHLDAIRVAGLNRATGADCLVHLLVYCSYSN
jgi:hypothetical protein